jgi:hypothetical protein
MNSKDKGNLAELAAAKKIISKDMSVAFPFGDNERYDLIIDNGQQLEKAQVRKASKRDNYIVFKCYSNHRSEGEIKRDTFEESEIDCFLVWYQEKEKIYKVPIEESPKTEMRLRLRRTENNQRKNVNWADDYKI